MVSSTNTLDTHTSIQLTIEMGYIIAAYLVGAKLTRGLTIQAANLMALEPTLPVGMMQQAQAPAIGLIILAAGLIAPLWFTWTARCLQNKKLNKPAD